MLVRALFGARRTAVWDNALPAAPDNAHTSMPAAELSTHAPSPVLRRALCWRMTNCVTQKLEQKQTVGAKHSLWLAGLALSNVQPPTYMSHSSVPTPSSLLPHFATRPAARIGWVHQTLCRHRARCEELKCDTVHDAPTSADYNMLAVQLRPHTRGCHGFLPVLSCTWCWPM